VVATTSFEQKITKIGPYPTVAYIVATQALQRWAYFLQLTEGAIALVTHNSQDKSASLRMEGVSCETVI
jgi:hypothetical protein